MGGGVWRLFNSLGLWSPHEFFFLNFMFLHILPLKTDFINYATIITSLGTFEQFLS